MKRFLGFVVLFAIMVFGSVVYGADAAAVIPVAAPTTTQIMAAVLGVLLAISEALALSSSIRSNSIFQMAWNILKTLAGK